MLFVDDEIGLEAALAEQLDEIAAELNGIAEQLRRKPLTAVESQLEAQYKKLGELRRAGRMVAQNQPDIAQRLLRTLTGKSNED